MKTITTTFLFATLAILCACDDKQHEAPAHSVMLVRPEAAGGERVKTYSGVVEEAKEISVGFKVAGQINKLYVKEGDFIRKGQSIALLDDKDYRLGAEALQIQYAQLTGEVERIKHLYAGKSVSENDYEKAVAGLQQVKIELQGAINKLEYTHLISPAEGYVQRVNFEPSEMVDAGTPVITLLDMNGMEVKVDIPVGIYRQKNKMESFTCRPVSADGGEQMMRLTSIVPKADGTQMYRMRLAFTEVPAGLTAGMNVEVGIHLSDSTGAGTYILPLHCVLKEGKSTYVWTMDRDSVVHKTEIELGGTAGSERVVVTAGLKGDEQVVKAGADALQDNEKVKVVNDDSETNVGGLL